ncbi:unnamed protein product [Malus baccata var. baccata]
MDEPTSGLWVWDFNTFCWVFTGICAGLVQYLGTTLTKKTDVVFVSSFTPISMILVIGLSAMILHDCIKKSSIGGVIMIVIGLSIFHWGEYRSTSKEEARVEEERLRWRLNLRRRFKLWRRFELMRGGTLCMCRRRSLLYELLTSTITQTSEKPSS